MPKIVNIKTGKEYPIRIDSRFTLIGRSAEADVNVPDFNIYISRFHATIFRHGNDFYLLDHSYNGTYYPVYDRAKPLSDKSLMKSEILSDSKARNGNRTKAGYRDLVTTISGYVPHGFRNREDLMPLLDALENSEIREKMIKQQGKTAETIILKGIRIKPVARKLEHGAMLAITKDNLFTYLEE